MKNKKGDAFQILVMLVLLLVVALVGLMMLTMTSRVNEFWDESGLLNQSEIANETISSMQEVAPTTTDYTILLLFIGMNVGVIIGAVRTNFSVTLLFMFIFLTLLSILTAAGVVNIYQGIAQQPSIIDVSGNLVITNFIFSKYLPLVVSIISAFILLIMYGKSGGDMVP